MKKRTFVQGTIIGVVLGAVAGILLAPKSGKETQEDIKRKVKGTASEAYARIESLSDEVSGRLDNLKDAAKDLRGEAKEESQELVRRAEVLKQDLRISATNLSKNGATVKDATMKDMKQLFSEGSSVMKELERVTRKLVDSSKDKAKDIKNGNEDDAS
jgi:gas vesicle protein